MDDKSKYRCKCFTCDGSGKVTKPLLDDKGYTKGYTIVKCVTCRGRGLINANSTIQASVQPQ